MQHLLLFFALYIATSATLSSQLSTHSHLRSQCGSDDAAQRVFQQNPNLRALHTLIDHALYQRLSSHRHDFVQNDQHYSIPVVVHIVHNGGSENIGDSQVQEGIRHINEALAHLLVENSATVTISLCLAQQDDNALPSSGITRTQSPLTNMTTTTDDLALKNTVRWNPHHYLNIWIVQSITGTGGSSTAGYAYQPYAHGSPIDGIVVEAQYFGTPSTRSAAVVHELGHYLGLYHTFEGGCDNSNCLLNGDRVCDTPPDASTARTACDTPPNSCHSDSDDPSANNPYRSTASGGKGDQSDMITNIMDYGDIACLRRFTPGQVRRMQEVLLSVRNSLLSSPGCKDPCTANVSASFTTNKKQPFAGEEVQFTNASSGMNTFKWRINGADVSTTEHLQHIFTAPGIYSVVLEASNGDIRCTRLWADTIIVRCRTRAQFAASSVYVEPSTVVSFSNGSTAASSYSWYIDNKLLSTSTHFSSTFTEAGGHLVMLIASDGLCSDTAYAFVNVGSCGTRQYDVWYFGNKSGIDFATEPPTPLSNSVMDTREGCASICNSEGQLLFYTDGVSVWNRLHRIMAGGDQTLGGHSSSTQSALILPQPGYPNRYYIFTVDAEENFFDNGLSYAVVDMMLDNGAGEVVEVKRGLKTGISERLTAVGRPGGYGFWIVVRGLDDKFFSFDFTINGVNSTPVTSSVGRIYDQTQAAGVMKISPNGAWLAIANLQGGEVAIHPFDPYTGQVERSGSSILSTVQRPYGIEFSPNSRYLYCSQSLAPYGVYQFDLSATGTIESSAFFMPSTDHRMGMLQIAPNGHIYVARYGAASLAAIRSPDNAKAACDYRDNAVVLPHPSRFGLPAVIALPAQHQQGTIEGPKTLCVGASASYTLVGQRSTLSPIWTHQGTAAFALSNDKKAVLLSPTAPGRDTLIALYSGRCSILIDTIVVESSLSPVVSLGSDTTLCGQQPVVLDPGSFASYVWSNGTTSRTLSVSTPGKYWVTVASAQGCTSSDTIEIVPPKALSPNLGNDTSVCSGVYVVDAGSGFRRYRWPDGSTEQRFTVFSSGTYIVEVETFCGVWLRDTVVVAMQPAAIGTSPDVTINLGGSTQLAVMGDISSVEWTPSNGLDDPSSTTPVASPQTTTTYTVRGVNSQGCAVQGSVTVTLHTLPLLTQGDTTICLGGSARLAVLNPPRSVLWTPTDGLNDPTSPEPVASPSQTTTYKVRSTDPADTRADGYVTVVVERLALDVCNDTTICFGGSAQLAVYHAMPSVEWSPAEGLSDALSLSPVASPTETTTYTVRGTLPNGCIAENYVTVTVQKDTLYVSGDTTICAGGSAQLAVLHTAGSVRWTPPDGLDDPTSLRPVASPSQTTTYTVRQTLPAGCIAEARVVVTVRSAVLPTSGDTTICPGESVQLIAQSGSAAVQWIPITGLDNPTSPAPLASPSQTTTYTVRSTSPEGCPVEAQLTVYVANNAPNTLSLPDTSAQLGEYIGIPLSITVADHALPVSIPRLTLVVRYRAALLKTTSVSRGALNVSTSGDYETARIQLSDITLARKQDTLVHMYATAYLGDSTATALSMEYIPDTEHSCLTFEVHSGSFTPAGVCNLPVRQVRKRDLTPTTLTATPNPASNEAAAVVATSEEGTHTLTLYSMQGRPVWQQHFTHSGSRASHTISIVPQQWPSGLYQLVLTTPSQALTTTLSVVQ